MSAIFPVQPRFPLEANAAASVHLDRTPAGAFLEPGARPLARRRRYSSSAPRSRSRHHPPHTPLSRPQSQSQSQPIRTQRQPLAKDPFRLRLRRRHRRPHHWATPWSQQSQGLRELLQPLRLHQPRGSLRRRSLQSLHPHPSRCLRRGPAPRRCG